MNLFKKSYVDTSHKQAVEFLENTRKKIYEICKTIIRNNFDNLIFTSLSDSITFLVEPSTVNINNFYNQIIKVCDEI